MIVRRRVVALALLAQALTGCATPTRETPTPAPTPVVLRVAADDLGESLARDLADGYRSVRSDVVVVVVTDPADAAFEINADRGASSAPFRTPLAQVTLGPVVATDFTAPALSSAQLKALIDGTIDDWSQLGGQPGLTAVVSRDPGSVGGAIAMERLGVSALAPDTQLAPDWAAARLLIAQTVGAIGILPASEVDSTVKAVPLDRTITVSLEAVASQTPTGPAYDFLAWAQSPAGQVVVGRRHVPLP